MAFHKWFWGVCVIILAACQPVRPETPAPVLPTGTATRQVLLTPSVTSTLPLEPTFTPSPTLTATAEVSPSPVASATPGVQFDQLKILAIDNRVGGWTITLALPGAQGGMRLLLGGQTYDCLSDPAYPDRLFCQGLARPAYDTPLKLVFQNQDSNEILYETTLTIASALMLPPTPAGWGYNTCADRGKNVSCETECRIAPDGNPCIVATCTDACGPYFSVHTCPDMPMDFRSCSPEQWAALKKMYQIP
ncbi:MAG TPA: hypothetical protein DEQ80_10795 [Anaerolinea thermolimosa]|uniref:Uncharacterized protein n=1 Tax=Anaerolinea thermolimosa TaxID=229919 RepID=A0A3D1JL06_9CHLR|nr:hypothetical protein [Anaerolinea thermolimosa]